MSKALTTRRQRTDLATLTDEARQYAQASKAPNTKRAYDRAWADFSRWAQDQGAEVLPAGPLTVAQYLTDLATAGARTSTIDVKRAAIAFYHRTANQPDPTTSGEVRAVMAGIRRQLGQPANKKAPVTPDELRAIVAALPDTLMGHRDRALILTGFAGAFRRSELVALDVDDLRITAGGMKIRLRRSKTDQEGKGQSKSIPHVQTLELDAVSAMRRWLDAAGIKSGPVFRQIDRWGNLRDTRLLPQAVAMVLKRAAIAAGLEPRQFSGHSLRSGFITAAADAGAQEWEIQQQTGHRSTQVLRGYIQDSGAGARRAVLAAVNGHAPKDDTR